MGKKVTYTATRQDADTPWYYQTPLAANNTAWNNRLQFIIDNADINSSATSTDTSLTSIVTFVNDADYDNFAILTQDTMNDVIAYCNANGITYNVVVEDI